MKKIRPVSDLRNNFSDISKIVHETQEPVFLTKNGYGDMVVMSIEAYERRQFESEIYYKLKGAELEAKSTSKRYSHKVIFSSHILLLNTSYFWSNRYDGTSRGKWGSFCLIWLSPSLLIVTVSIAIFSELKIFFITVHGFCH